MSGRMVAAMATALIAATTVLLGEEAYRRIEMTLSGMATSGDDAVLHLHVRDDRSTGGWATIKGQFCEVRKPDFRIARGRLRGRAVLVHGGATYALRIDAAETGGKLAGTFDVVSGVLGIRPEFEGDVAGQIQQHYDPGSPTRISVYLPSQYTGVVLRRPRMEFTLAGGKATDGRFVSLNGLTGKWGFSGRVDEAELTRDGKHLAGTITGTITNGGSSHGEYAFAVDAGVRANVLVGRVKMRHEGKETGEGAVTGTAVPVAEHVDAEDALWVLDLAGGLGNDSRLELRLARAAGKFTDAYGGGGTHKADASALAFSGGRLTGRVKVVFLPGKNYPPHGKELHAVTDISATVRDGKITGSHEAAFDVQDDKSGEANGRVLNEAELPKRGFGAEKTPWACWRGPHANGTAIETGLELVDDLADAELVWESEDYVPHANPEWRSGHWSGEYASPIVAEGRVYLGYWRPPGRDHHRYTKEDRDHLSKGRNPTTGRTDLTADDIVHCFDMKTGKTVWKRIFEGKGRMIPGFKGGAHMTMCYGDGKVFAPGVAGNLYGLDAATGSVLWEQAQACHLHVAPAYADGVVAVYNRGGREGPLRGHDAATGRLLWAARAGSARSASPIVWRHKGKSYFIRCGALVEAKTGKICWQIPNPDGSTAEAVSGDILVMPYRGKGGHRTAGATRDRNGMTAFRINPEKYEKLWQLPMPNRHGSQFVPGLIYKGHTYGHIDRLPGTGEQGRFLACVELATGKIVATIPEQSGFGYSPVAAEGRIFSGGITMFDADPANFKTLTAQWRAKRTPGGIAGSTSLAYVNGFLFFRGETTAEGRLYCYDLRKGRK